ncbi:PNOC protein, partial [Nicator chloris]|nr:PNOC protein [Nicator chloris]
MRAVLWDLLLLCLFARARGDCRGDCLHCDRQLYRDSFDVLVSATTPAPAPTTPLLPPPGSGDIVSATPPAPVPMGALLPLLGSGAIVTPADPARLDAAEPAAPGALAQPRREEEEEEEDISRRLGAGRAAKGVQKRYGGFIGVRKSARKWNNQKRFSEFLKQYLGMAPRSSEYGPGGAGHTNEI